MHLGTYGWNFEVFAAVKALHHRDGIEILIIISGLFTKLSQQETSNRLTPLPPLVIKA